MADFGLTSRLLPVLLFFVLITWVNTFLVLAMQMLHQLYTAVLFFSVDFGVVIVL